MALSHPTIINNIDYGDLVLVNAGGVKAVTTELKLKFTELSAIDCDALPQFYTGARVQLWLSDTAYTTFWVVNEDDLVILKMALRHLHPGKQISIYG